MKAIFLILTLFMFCCKNEIIEPMQIISDFQQKVLDEINFARTDPKNYAELRLKGIEDNGSYSYMKNLEPLLPISFNNSLNLSASKYANFLSKNNVMGHDCDKTPIKRAMLNDYDGDAVGESIAASSGEKYNCINSESSINFIVLMIIDTGVTDLGHRKTIFSNYTNIGVGYSRNLNSTFINYIVIDFGK